MPFLVASLTFWGLDKFGARDVCMGYEHSDMIHNLYNTAEDLTTGLCTVEVQGVDIKFSI